MYKIIMNPPYNGNLHLKILQEAMKYGDEIVNLSPITELVSLTTEKNNTLFLDKNIKSIERVSMMDAQDLFQARIFMDLGIYYIVKGCGGRLKDIDKFELRGMSKSFNGIWNKLQSKGKRFSDFITAPDTLMKKYCVVFNHMSGLTKSHDFVYHNGVAPDGKTYKEHVINQHKNETTDHFEFETYDEAENFRKYVHSPIIKFIQRCVDYSGRLSMKAFPFMPTYSHPWTDAELYEYFQLTPDEIKEIEDAANR